MRAYLPLIIFTTNFWCSLISARQIFDRIVNGQPATQGQFPNQVSWCYDILYDNETICHTLCGGTILNETTIITAAHCCDNDWVDHPNTKIVAGELDSLNTSGLEQVRMIKNLTIHPNYNASTSPVFQHDICLLTLDSPLKFDENVKRINFDLKDPVVDTVCQVSGWGGISVSIQKYAKIIKYIFMYLE